MPKLKTIYDSLDEIPEAHRELFAERNGKFELVGVEGIKTQADIDRVQSALVKERNEHKEAKEKLAKFGDLDPEKVHEQLEAGAEAVATVQQLTKDGKLDESKVQERIDAAIAKAVGPVQREKTALERQLDAQKKAVAERDAKIGNLEAERIQDKIAGTLRDAAIAAKVLPTAIDDAVLVGARMFEVTEDGRIITRDNVGVTPGIDANAWFKDMQERRPHWWPTSVGGGAQGGRGTPGSGADNPWSAEGWNITRQGQYVRTHGEAKAAEAAKAVGSALGATKPPAPKSKAA
jgi:hypothetical protein